MVSVHGCGPLPVRGTHSRWQTTPLFRDLQYCVAHWHMTRESGNDGCCTTTACRPLILVSRAQREAAVSDADLEVSL